MILPVIATCYVDVFALTYILNKIKNLYQWLKYSHPY